jgi:8-oxo-dGTP diphosphatase
MEFKLNPHISVDCVIFGFDFDNLKVLLIERELKGFGKDQNDMKLPGSLVSDTEDPDSSANRTLKELTGLENIYLKQFHVFGSLDRLKNELDLNWLRETSGLPIERVVSIAYYALIKIEDTSGNNFENKFKDHWVNLKDVPKLAFDHNEIIDRALESLQKEMKTEPIGFELLPKKFTIFQLQRLFEVIMRTKIDSRNFRKKLAKLKYLHPLEEKEEKVAHKPAQLYKFDKKAFLRSKLDNIGFTLFYTKK